MFDCSYRIEKIIRFVALIQNLIMVAFTIIAAVTFIATI